MIVWHMHFGLWGLYITIW